jgi:hypothetical protein
MPRTVTEKTGLLQTPTNQTSTKPVKSHGTFQSRSIGTGSTNPGTRVHVRTAQGTLIQMSEQKALDRARVEKAVPGSSAIFDVNAYLNTKSRIPTDAPFRMIVGRTETELTIGVDLLTGEIPMGGADLAQAKYDVNQCIARLTKLNTDIDGHGASKLSARMKATIQDTLDQLNNRKAYLEHFDSSHSLTQTKVCDAKIGWAEAACRVIDKEIAKLPNGHQDPRQQDLEQLKVDILNTAANYAPTTDPNARVEDGGHLKTANKDLGKQIASKLKELGIRRNEKSLTKAVYEEHIDILNDRDWNPIHGDIHFVHDGKAETFKSEITPAAHMGLLKASYEGKGICCQSRSEANHMVNLAKTTLKSTDGRELFSGIRHGIVSAFGIKNRANRLQANENRAKELLVGVLSSKPALMQAALGPNPGVIDLDLTSINLLTPDPIRYFFGGKMGGGTDRAITRDQLNTLQAIDGKEIEVKFTDDQGNEHTVKVRPNIAAFSFGVNEGATKDSKKGALMYYGGGKASFEHVRRDNGMAMQRLIGNPTSDTVDANSKIGRFLNDPNTSETDRKIVMELRDQIRTMWNNDDYMAHGGDPHKMVSRLSVLTHIIGQTPCFNCKSGKDRTGTLDVEAKFLATRIDFARKQAAANNADPTTFKFVPDPGPLSKEDQAMFRQIAIRSGNLEVQEYNTGIGGYKTAAQKALQRRLGTTEAVSRFKGGSAHVKA